MARGRIDEDDDDDDRPRRRDRGRRDDDDWDERDDRDDRNDDNRDAKPGLATAAAVLWLIWAVLLLLAFILRLVIVLKDVAGNLDMNPVCGGMDALLVLVLAAWCGLAGLLTITGKAQSLTAYGVLSLILPPAMVLMEVVIAFFMGLELAQERKNIRSDAPLVLAFRSFIFNSILVSGVILAAIFALSANKRYRLWSSRQ